MANRGFLLNSLILGASILVWLTIIGSAIVAVEVVREQSKSAPSEIVPLNHIKYDSYGVPCSQSESQSGC